MNAYLTVLAAVSLFVVVYISLSLVTDPVNRDLQRRADENAQKLLEHHRKQNERA